MKKVITIALAALLLTGCFGPKTYDEISYKKLNKMIDKKESFVLVIGKETCSACMAYKVVLDEIIKNYGVDIKYLDIAKLTEEEATNLIYDFPFSSTPTTIFITKGEEKDTNNRIIGSDKYSKVVQKLKDNGYIKEKANG